MASYASPGIQKKGFILIPGDDMMNLIFNPVISEYLHAFGERT